MGAAVLAAGHAEAAARYWVGGSGSWGATLHWSLASGGAGGASVPGSGDDAIFDAASGSATVVLDRDATVRDLLITGSAPSGLTLDFRSRRLTATRDALLLSGRVDQGLQPGSRLVVGRNLDTANTALSAVSDYNLTVEMSGTGWWRYSLAGDRQPRIWDLSVAAPGQTTTLRPVGSIPQGTDLDVDNQLLLGDSSSLLTMDLSEATSSNAVTIELHQREATLDTVSNGARFAVDAFEHEMASGLYSRGDVQNRITFQNLGRYDLTGAHNAAPGSGVNFDLLGPLDVGSATVFLEKTVVLDTRGHPIDCAGLQVGGGSLGTAEIHVRDGAVRVSGQITIGDDDIRPGRIHVDEGLVIGRSFRINQSHGFIRGADGGAFELTGSAPGAGRTVYVSASGNDANSGTSTSSPLRTFARAESELRTGTVVLFRRGDSFPVGSGARIDATGGAIGAYGSGDRPVWAMAAGGQLDVAGNWSAYDVRVEFGASAPPPPEPPAPPVLLP